MSQFNFVSIKLTLCLCLGIVLGFYLAIPAKFSFWALIVMLPILYLARLKESRKGIPFFELTTLALSIALGVFIVGISISNSLSGLETEGEKLWELKVEETLKTSAFNQRYIAKVLTADAVKQNGKLIVSFPLDSSARKLKVDDEIILYAPIKSIKAPLNPYQFNYQNYQKKQGIHYQIETSFKSVLTVENPSITLYGLAFRFREHIISKLKKEAFGTEELSVIQALLLGQRDDISESTYNNYKNAGAVHILAVSGLHVGILLLLLQFLLLPIERLPKGKGLKLITIVLLLWGYAFIAGLSPSIVRAVAMFSFLAYAMHLKRPTNAFNILALSMFFTLLVKPLFLFQVGFQMSYVAVFAIVWIYPKLQRFWFPDNILIRKVWQLLAVSISAQLGVLPVSLFYFHQFPALFFVSNLLVIPFLGLLLSTGILVIVLSFADVLPHFLAVGYNFLIQTMNTVVAWVGQQERFLFKAIPFDGVQLVLGYFLVIALTITLTKPKIKNIWVLGSSILLLQLWAIWTQHQSNNKESLILAHQAKQTLLLQQQGNSLKVHSRDTNFNPTTINNFKIAERIESSKMDSLKSSYHFNQKKLFIMDSFGSYPKAQPLDYLLLTQSPKIHLDRLLDSLRPKMVLADGSNYRSYISQWKTTCAQKEIPFHSTSEKGYFVFKPTEN